MAKNLLENTLLDSSESPIIFMKLKRQIRNAKRPTLERTSYER